MPEKDEQSAATQHAPSGSRSSTSGAAAGVGRASQGRIAPPGRALCSREKRFIVAARRIGGIAPPAGLAPSALDYVEQALRSSPDIEVTGRIAPKGFVGTLADAMGATPHILIAKMADDKADILRQQSAGQLIVEQDQDLSLYLSGVRPPGLVASSAAGAGTALSIAVMVLGRDNTPLRDVELHLFGAPAPVCAVTDERGVATLSLPGDAVALVTGLYVKPRSDFWSLYQSQPSLDTDQTNLVFLRPLAESFQGFPRQQAVGWGQKLMRLDQLPGNYRGQGARVAIVDSGVATSHPALQRIKHGYDAIHRSADPDAWSQDAFGHGTHCAGILAAADNHSGIRGFAPDAEVHVCRVFPGGRIGELVETLEYCIEKQIDVVHLSLGAIEPSEVLEQQILRAKRLGVACIAAAGDSGGAVQYPASGPNVLAVAAIGKLDEFPSDSYHTQSVGPIGGGMLFSPKFASHGPEVAVCAPGVAILSCAPPNHYAVSDGSSMAAAHVSGLAALILAHHPEFQGPFRARTAERVERLFQILKACAQPVNFGDARRTGFGIPDVLASLALAPHPGMLSAMNLYPSRAAFGAAGVPFGINQAAALYGTNPLLAQMAAFGFGQAFAGPASYPHMHTPVGVW